MPRDKFQDPTVSGRYAQINWRRRDEATDDTVPYVQISTHHEGESTVSELLGQAIGLLSNVDAPGGGWPNQSDEWREVVTAWLDRAAKHASETTGEYVQVGPDEIADVIKTLHKAKRQAFDEPQGGVVPPSTLRFIGDTPATPGDAWVPTGTNGEGYWV